MTYGDAIHGTITVLARRNWRAVEALHAIMVNFDHNGRTWYQGNWYNNSMLWTLPEMLKAPADKVPVMFWGGPPTDRKYHTGTIMDYLMDACFFELSQKDPDMKLYNFLNDTVESEQTVRAGAP